jgi:hypothetical protein
MDAHPDDFDSWRADPAAFIEDVLRDPETGERFVLNASQRAFLKHAFKRDAQGRLLSLFTAHRKKAAKPGSQRCSSCT